MLDYIHRKLPPWIGMPIVLGVGILYWYCTWLHEESCRIWLLAGEAELEEFISAQAIEYAVAVLTIGALLAAGLLIAAYARMGYSQLFRKTETILQNTNLDTASRRGQTEFQSPGIDAEQYREVDRQLESLTREQKLIVRQVLLRGSMMPSRMQEFAQKQGFEFNDASLSDIRNKTDFLEGSFTGHFSINAELKLMLGIKLKHL